MKLEDFRVLLGELTERLTSDNEDMPEDLQYLSACRIGSILEAMDAEGIDLCLVLTPGDLVDRES